MAPSKTGSRGPGPKGPGKVVPIGLDDELADSYGRYAQAIILDRAIPDARDGLKPVQRRIVYAMFESSNIAERPYRKSAKTVGDVMGNYHPHGDQSIYDALVRLAQPWKMRYPLIDGHGNFGSPDDDPPAAMRYTEARLSPVAAELTRDIHKSTVDWRPNFDDKALEPVVLPAAFPNLLANGTSGVSTGFATEIPPHNLVELIEAAQLVLDSPDVELDELMQFVRGPDYPTGGILTDLDGLKQAYKTGKGRVVLQARWSIEKQRDGKSVIAVTELPYGVNKAKLVADLEGLRVDKAVHGVVDVRDESDREGLRVAIETSKTANIDVILAVLLKKTDLRIYYHFNMVAIHQGRPEQMGLRDLLRAYVLHRRDVVVRRSQHDLDRATARLHVVEGLIRAVDILDDIIATIRASRDRKDARANLVELFTFTEAQADAILDLRLHRLTGLQILELEQEMGELKAEITRLQGILTSEAKLKRQIKRELKDIAVKYGDARRTEIQADVEKYDISVEATIRRVDVALALSREGYVRRSSAGSFRAGGSTLNSLGAREGDYPLGWQKSSTTEKSLIITRTGTCYAIPVHQLPEDKWSGTGSALINVVPIDKSDRVVAIHGVDFGRGKGSVDTASDGQLLMVTSRGYVKRTALTDFDSSRSSGIVAMGLAAGDHVAAALRVGGDADILLVTRMGQGIRFRQEDVSIQGRSARGVRGMGLDAKDAIVSVVELPSAEDEAACESVSVVFVTEHGKAKRTRVSEIPRQLRAGKGSRVIKAVKRNPHRIAAAVLPPADSARLLAYSAAGERLEVEAGSIPTTVRDGNAFSVGLQATEYVLVDAWEPPEPESEPEDESAVDNTNSDGVDSEAASAADDDTEGEEPQLPLV